MKTWTRAQREAPISIGLRVPVQETKMIHHSGWLVVSSAQDFMPWINKHFVDPSSSKLPEKYNIKFGVGMIDESHEEYFKQTGRGKIIYDIPTNRPYLWEYSGTTFS